MIGLIADSSSVKRRARIARILGPSVCVELGGAGSHSADPPSKETAIEAAVRFLAEDSKNIVVGLSRSGGTFQLAANKYDSETAGASVAHSESVDDALSVELYTIRLIDIADNVSDAVAAKLALRMANGHAGKLAREAG